MICIFGPKSRDNPPKCFQQLYYIGQIYRGSIRARPKNYHCQSATAPKDWGIQTFRNDSEDHDLTLESERESTGLNRAEKFKFEY